MGTWAALLHALAWVTLFWGIARPRFTRRALVVAACALLAGGVLSGGIIFVKWAVRAIMPPALVGIGLLSLTAWQFRKRERTRFIVAALAAIYWLGSNPHVGSLAMRSLEEPFAAGASSTAPLDLVFVLGGGTAHRLNGDRQLSRSGDRVATVARMYHRGETKQIGVTGTGIGEWQKEDIAGDTAALLVELGVPFEALVPMQTGRNTREELDAMAAYAQAHPTLRLGICSSAWHLRRVGRNAERRHLQVRLVPSDSWGAPPPWSVFSLQPSAEAFLKSRVAAWEWLGGTFAP